MKKRKKNPLQKINFEIHSAYGCDDENDDEICYLVEDAYNLFYKHGIRLSKYETPALIAADENFKLLGALFGGKYPGNYDDEQALVRFSVVVKEKARRAGIYKALLKQFIKDMVSDFKYNGEYGSLLIQAWVINPNTIPVLEELGFEHSEGREWKEDSPFFNKEIAL